MIKYIFAVFDEKSGIFGNSFTAINVAVATRDFLHACANPTSDLGRYPEDFVLYRLGSIDDTKGVIDALQKIEFITKGTAQNA